MRLGFTSTPSLHSLPRLLAMMAFGIGLAATRAQGTAGTPATAPTSLAHVALRATDIERTLVFYRDYLGFTERFRTDEVPGKPNVYYKRDQPPAPGERAVRQLLLSTSEPEPQGGLGVFDLETFHARLQSAAPGLGLNPPPALEPDLQDVRFFELCDPDGFRLRVVELSDSRSGQAGSL